MKNIPQPYSWALYRKRDSLWGSKRLKKPWLQLYVGIDDIDVLFHNQDFWESFSPSSEPCVKPKTWDREITSERQALRETARLWRYVARTGEWKPKTSWGLDCPLCHFLHCENCLNNFWGAVEGPRTDRNFFMNKMTLCVDSAVSAYLKWKNNWGIEPRKAHYYALRIRWAALRALHDHFSS